MPVIPDPKDLPSVSRNGNNESQNQSGEQHQKASATDYLSKGPQISDDMPPKASREEIEKRMKELNKSTE